MTNITEAILEHRDMLSSYAIRLTQDRDAARDLCQDTLFKALANRTKFNHGADVRPWLFTIMRNQFINSYRRKKLEKALFSRSTPEMLSHADVSTYAFATANIELREMQSIIDTMPAILRTPLHLFCQGYRYHEIADLTGAAVGTIKSRIYTARQLLRRHVNSDLYHNPSDSCQM